MEDNVCFVGTEEFFLGSSVHADFLKNKHMLALSFESSIFICSIHRKRDTANCISSSLTI